MSKIFVIWGERLAKGLKVSEYYHLTEMKANIPLKSKNNKKTKLKY